jgi:hypothetical protein
MLSFHPHFGIRHNQDGRVVSCTRRTQFTPKEIAWYSFLLQAEWAPGLLNADRRIGGTWRFPKTPRRIEIGAFCRVTHRHNKVHTAIPLLIYIASVIFDFKNFEAIIKFEIKTKFLLFIRDQIPPPPHTHTQINDKHNLSAWLS